MAKVIPIGEPVNEAERQAIAHLRDNLPASYLVLHNFEVERGGELFEVDVAVVAPHAVYLVDVKGTRGLIDVYGSKWYPDGRQPYTSPLLKLRGHARSLKGVITDSQPSRRDLKGIYVDAVVLLTAPDAVIQDPGGRDSPSVTTLKKAPAFFRNAGRIPGKFSKNISSLRNMVLKALQGVGKPKSGPQRFGSWEVKERLSATDSYTEYRAVNMFAGPRAGTVLLRVYQADAYLPPEEHEAQRTRISNAYTALSRMPGHPGIVGARDFFETEARDRYVLVTEDVPGAGPAAAHRQGEPGAHPRPEDARVRRSARRPRPRTQTRGRAPQSDSQHDSGRDRWPPSDHRLRLRARRDGPQPQYRTRDRRRAGTGVSRARAARRAVRRLTRVGHLHRWIDPLRAIHW